MAHPLSEVSNFSYDTLNKELALSKTETASVQVFLDAYLDDFWQDGKESLLPPAGGKNSTLITGLFEKRFVFRNVIKEVCGRVAGAFFGKAPNWKFQQSGKDLVNPATLTEEERKAKTEGLLDDTLLEAEKALSSFWTRQDVATELAKAFSSRLAFGRGGWRLYVPLKFKRKNLVTAPGAEPVVGDEKAATEEGFKEQLASDYVKFENITEALDAMRLEFIPPTQGRLLDDGGEYFSIIKYNARDNWETLDVSHIIEFSFVDNSDRTFVGTLTQKGGVSKLLNANLSDPLKLAGLTTFSEFRGTPYVTKALYKNNQLLNLALTCAGFSLVDNGFGEMVLTNVELETRTVTGPDGEPVEIPKQIPRGGGVINNFIGINELDDTTGAQTRATPGVTFREASAISPFKDGFDLAYLACLQEAGQMYALISGDATASGESRIQALSDFLLKIMPYKAEVDFQGGWLLTAALLWAAELSGTALQDTTVVYDSRVHVASLSAEEKTTVMAMRKDGVISRETERVLLGIDDPALENDLVNRESTLPPGEVPVEDLSERADLALKLLGLGLDQETIWKILGFTDQQLAEIKQRAADEQAALQQSIADAQAAAGLDAGGKPANNPGQGFSAGA